MEEFHLSTPQVATLFRDPSGKGKFIETAIWQSWVWFTKMKLHDPYGYVGGLKVTSDGGAPPAPSPGAAPPPPLARGAAPRMLPCRPCTCAAPARSAPSWAQPMHAMRPTRRSARRARSPRQADDQCQDPAPPEPHPLRARRRDVAAAARHVRAPAARPAGAPRAGGGCKLPSAPALSSADLAAQAHLSEAEAEQVWCQRLQTAVDALAERFHSVYAACLPSHLLAPLPRPARLYGRWPCHRCRRAARAVPRRPLRMP